MRGGVLRKEAEQAGNYIPYDVYTYILSATRSSPSTELPRAAVHSVMPAAVLKASASALAAGQAISGLLQQDKSRRSIQKGGAAPDSPGNLI